MLSLETGNHAFCMDDFVILGQVEDWKTTFL